jgi:hypothetical protein
MSYSDKKITTEETLPPIPDNIREEFGKVLRVQASASNEHLMHYFLTRWLNKKKFSWEYDEVGNILVTKGLADWYPCVVAHLDTVHPIMSSFKLFRTKTKDDHDILYAKCGKHKTGIGGDNKCGIYSLLYLLERCETIKCVFFTGEESGCVGSGEIDLSLLDDVGYVIQLDRWGRKDFICEGFDYHFVSDEFQDAVADLKTDFGYEDAEGLITDSVKLFKRGLGVSCINLSCGYYQHHSQSEKIDLNQYWNALRFTEKIIERLGCNPYEKALVKKPIKPVSHDSYDGEVYAGYIRGNRNGVKGYWMGGTFYPDEEPYENKEVKGLWDEDEQKENPPQGDFDWMVRRFAHVEYEQGVMKYFDVNPKEIIAIMETLMLDALTEEKFNALPLYDKNLIGEEYFVWIGSVLYDHEDQLSYGWTDGYSAY